MTDSITSPLFCECLSVPAVSLSKNMEAETVKNNASMKEMDILWGYKG